MKSWRGNICECNGMGGWLGEWGWELGLGGGVYEGEGGVGSSVYVRWGGVKVKEVGLMD